MKQCTSGGCCQDSNGIWLIVCTIVGALKGVDGDINSCGLRMANHGTELFSDVEHGCLVSFSFSNGHSSIKRHSVKGASHSFNGGVVSSNFVPFPTPGSARNGCLVNRLEEVMCKVGGGAHVPLCSRECHE
jgi:hypothetical protein